MPQETLSVAPQLAEAFDCIHEDASGRERSLPVTKGHAFPTRSN